MRNFYEPKRPRVRRPKEQPFKATKYSHGPEAHAAHDAGGKLLSIPMPSRAKFAAELAAYAPGCGSPIRVPGTNGGSARCGATVGSEKAFCDHCRPSKVAESVVTQMLEADDFDPEAALAALPDRREVVLEVTLVFDQPIEDVSQVMHNVFTGLEHTQRQIGLAPEEESARTTRIKIRALKPRSRYIVDNPI